MTLNTFIRRPIFSGVISVLIVIMGLVSLVALPVEQFPDMAPPTVDVMTTYAGASAETTVKSVVTPLEEAINGVEGMTYMTSTASNTGDVDITVYFKKGVNPDMAAVNVQNRVQAALASLPAEVTRQGVTTEKQQNSELMTLALCSDNKDLDENFLNNYMSINVVPRLKRISGVGKVMLFGGNYNMRLWLNPDKMAMYKLVPDDVTKALEAQNVEAATGAFGENHDNTYMYTMKYRGRLSTPEQFGNIVIRSLADGQVLRLRDVARVELGSDAYNYHTGMDGYPTAMLTIQQTAGSNASVIINEINAAVKQMSGDLPEGIHFQKINDAKLYLDASIHTVVETLFGAILLVILVVWVFLQDLRSTFIPSVSIVVSLIGTFAFMQFMGFSLNLLTLFALVLAIGTVVDDAIIVVEAVQANFDKGYRSPYLASTDAMRNVAMALLTSTIVFMAVFIPVSMMGGTSGAFYRQFGLTMAAAVGISAINAFTLSPALCALLLRPYTDENGQQRKNFSARFRKAFNAVFSVMSQKYAAIVFRFIRHKYLSFGIIAAAVALLLVLVKATPTSLVPDEDTGMLYVNLTTKPGMTLNETDRALQQLDKKLAKIPGIAHRAKVSGYSFTAQGSNSGMFYVPLKSWNERGKGESLNDITEKINRAAADIAGASVVVMSPSLVPGFGMSSGFDLNLEDRNGGSISQFQQVKDRFVKELSRQPEIGSAYSEFSADYPQYWVDIDAAQCARAGITPNEILQTIQGYYGGSYISNFNRFSRLYNVTMQAEPDKRVTAESLSQVFVRLANGEMAPVTQFARLTTTTGPQSLARFNMFGSISVSGTPAEGKSNGQAMEAIARVAKKTLPAGYTYEYGGLSLEESKAKNNFAWVFGLSLLIIYLVLASLYESLLLPFAIILTVPVGILGSFILAQVMGLQNNIYMQTGIVLLIGLLAKTGILITEYAVSHRRKGAGLVQSACMAARDRLRPILMTVLTMLLGMLPLMVATGAGANGSRSLASCVVGGMVLGILALLFLVPTLFIIFQWLQERIMPRKVME
ncbi:MAG: efflux RND transporter permease subunit [Prevotella sp.]|jgi:HAE1 family hydrophobic/amphiphilic exporter-1|nr:efflux RND transporter permease subunit [Prevotella sp.]MCI2079572.1 efflux RND transporter permease subunit [Prevotella sp.]MCI2101664.1 efflux RND transporter permease subunit [Prevotella sp.]